MYSGKSFPLPISHRGLHTSLPENSIPAFLAAIDAGATGIELDIHASADDVLFVHHDPGFLINDAVVPFTSLDSSDLARLSLPGDVSVPTLDDALTAIGTRADVFIEIKATGLENAVARCLRRHLSDSDRYAVHSFDHRVARRMLELIPSVRTGILQVSYLVDTRSVMRQSGASDLWQHSDFIDASLVTDVHAAGGRIIAWTPNAESQWENLVRLGVDGICTDRIDSYVEWVESR